MFKCECGREFSNPQSFNGHKSNCMVHYIAKYGNDTKYKEQLARNTVKIENGNKKRLENQRIKRDADLEMWLLSDHKCESCGKIMLNRYGSGRFCCKSCANRQRRQSEESRNKISQSLKKRIQSNGSAHEERKCAICNTKILHTNKTGLCKKCLNTTNYGRHIMSKNGEIAYARMSENGTHKGWKSRNITSYAERFWETVLSNNKIHFNREVTVKHGKSNYFLDFVIEAKGKKIDLEIDGKQHTYKDRVESDKTRDEYIKSLGYVVYRVAWNDIKSDDGKIKMKEKINAFLLFYSSL